MSERTEQYCKKRSLDNLPADRLARGVSLTTPSPLDIERLFKTASQDIDGLAPLECILKVSAHNPDTMMALSRNGNNSTTCGPTSFVAQLPLNADGLVALFDGSMDTALPDLKYICRQNETPKAIYVWGIHVTKKTAGGIALVMQRLSTPHYRHAPLYCKAANENAFRFFMSLGFKQGATYKHWHQADMLEYQRETEPKARQQGQAPIYDSVPASASKREISVEVVHSIADYQKMIVIRAATYIAEHHCPYDEEFDGNDFAGTHLIGYVGKEPAGCIRVRFFAQFAKIERLSVLPRFRRSQMIDRLIRAGIELARKKGYQHLYGHAESHLVKLWSRYGFVPRTSDATYSFSDRDYVEGDLILDLSNNPITHTCPPHIINRPEGQWHKPGVLERGEVKS